MRFTPRFSLIVAATLLLALPFKEGFKNRQLMAHQKLGGSLRNLPILQSSPDDEGQNIVKKQSQIATLNLMAAKLRAEAAELEVLCAFQTSSTMLKGFTIHLLLSHVDKNH